MNQSGAANLRVQATVPVSVRVKQQPWMRRGSGSNIELVCLLTPELLFCYSAIQLRLDQWQSHKLQSVRGHLQLNGNRRCVRHLLMRETEKGISGRLQSEVRGFWLQMRSCFSPSASVFSTARSVSGTRQRSVRPPGRSSRSSLSRSPQSQPPTPTRNPPPPPRPPTAPDSAASEGTFLLFDGGLMEKTLG